MSDENKELTTAEAVSQEAVSVDSLLSEGVFGLSSILSNNAQNMAKGTPIDLKKDGVNKIIPLVYADPAQVPDSALKIADGTINKYLVGSFNSMTFWLDPDQMKSVHGAEIRDGKEFSKYPLGWNFRVGFTNQAEAKRMEQFDPIAWFFVNYPSLYSSMKVGFKDKFTPTQHDKMMQTKPVNPMVTNWFYMPVLDSEGAERYILAKMTTASKNVLQIINAASMTGNFRGYVFDYVVAKAGTNQISHELRMTGQKYSGELPDKPSYSDVAEADIGISYSSPKRKEFLVMLGLEDKFPSGVVWNS